MDTRIGVEPHDKEDTPAWEKQSKPLLWGGGHQHKDLSIGEEQDEAIQQRDPSDLSYLIYVLELSSEAFEAAGHLDLAAECESLCEELSSLR